MEVRAAQSSISPLESNRKGEEQPHSIDTSISKSLFESDIGGTTIKPVSSLAAKDGSFVLISTQSSPNLELFTDGINATQPIDEDALEKSLLTATPAPSKQAVSAPFDASKLGLNVVCPNESIHSSAQSRLNYANTIQLPQLHNTSRAFNIHALPFQPSIPVQKHPQLGNSLKELKEMESEPKVNSGGLQQGKSLKELKALAVNKEAVQTNAVSTKPLGLLDLKLIYECSSQISLIDMPLGMKGEEHKMQKDGGDEVSKIVPDKIEMLVDDENSYTLDAEMELNAIHILDDFNRKGELGYVWS
ncbi:unnamed protein product [Cuscuta campestris]|uniref:Uncharacterized protein n=1 Tax=Cuscuta campestris TaxID=132261 RepID=A0A484NED2_9ASTE|nr:unnamed protein product [Cuscuta campestris]